MRFATREGLAAKPDEENPYWISFSDIMSGLLIIFIMACLVLIFELTKTKVEVNDAIRELAKAESIRRTVVEEVQNELAKASIDIEVTDNHTVIRIPDQLLSFETDQYRIPGNAEIKNSIAVIAEVLYRAIQKDRRWEYLDTIFVEGHTDIRPSPRRMGNWGLSTFRAISVWNYWAETQPPEEQLSSILNHEGAPLFSVSGYGDTRPTTESQETEADLQRNRRIDLRITVKRPALEEFEALREMLE